MKKKRECEPIGSLIRLPGEKGGGGENEKKRLLLAAERQGRVGKALVINSPGIRKKGGEGYPLYKNKGGRG